jgi:hypothetical protein
MRTLEHRGQKIICQYINDSFCCVLMEKNIKYDILPIFSEKYIIYKYAIDGVVKYAMEELKGSYVYIVLQVPEDGWDALYNTVLHGEHKTSRLKMCINHICTIIDNEIKDVKFAEGTSLIEIMAYPQREYTSKKWQRIALYLITCGYCKENIEIDTDGVDPKWIEKIKEYI